MEIEGGTVGEKLLHLPDQGIVRLGHVEGDTAGFRSGQAKMFGKVAPDKFDIIRGQTP
jgi:hypothetical protein